MRNQVRVLLGTLLFGAVVAVAPTVSAFVSELRTFQVTEVDVRGTRILPRDSVLARLGDVASVWGDRSAWAERIERHPLVRRAEVRRRLPNGLLVEIEEREAVALAATPTLEPIDAEGVRLPIDPTRIVLDLPVIASGRMPPPDAAVVPAEVRELAVEVDHLARLDERFVDRISSVQRAPDGSLVVALVAPDVELRLPPRTPLDRLREAQAALEHALAVSPGRVPAVVDLRYADQVVVRHDR